MGRNYNRIAGLHRHQYLVHYCRCRIGAGSKSCDDTHWPGDLVQLQLIIPFYYAYSFDILDRFPDRFRRKLVFNFFMLRDTKTGFLSGHPSQTFGSPVSCLSHCFTYPVNFLLGNKTPSFLGFPRAENHLAGLLY